MGIVQAKAMDKDISRAALAGELFRETGLEAKNERYDDLAQIDLKNVKVRIDRVTFEGLERTKDHLVKECIGDLFKAKTIQDVLLNAQRTKKNLDELGCFKSVGIFIDTNKAANATQDGLEVVFNVEEYRRLSGRAQTELGNDAASISLGLRTPNVFGRGESFEFEYRCGSNNTANFNASFLKPFRTIYKNVLKTTVAQCNEGWPSSGYNMQKKGLIVDMAFQTSPLLRHNIQWEATVRELSPLSKDSSFLVREESGSTLKSAIKYILSIDLRDDKIFPTHGSSLKFTSELAGLGGDIGFLRNEFSFQDNYAVMEDIVFQTNFIAGYTSALNKNKKVTIADRCYLGGPLSLRGFETRGVGPHSDENSLGSSGYWAVSFHLFTPLPFRPGKGGIGDLVRTHTFINAGNIGDFGSGKQNSTDMIDELRRSLRLSYGFGVAIRLGNMAKVEVNYCIPHWYESGDKIHPGIQIGIGMNIL